VQVRDWPVSDVTHKENEGRAIPYLTETSGDRGAETHVISWVSSRFPFSFRVRPLLVRAVMRKYGDLPADFAEACLIQLADDLNTGDLLTLDRDFEFYRWRRPRTFRLLVALDSFGSLRTSSVLRRRSAISQLLLLAAVQHEPSSPLLLSLGLRPKPTILVPCPPACPDLYCPRRSHKEA
jgi:hypothetical protein